MKSIALLWNCVQAFRHDMIKDLSAFSKIKKIYQLDLGENLEAFVRCCYDSENMEKWKIDNKLQYMQQDPCTEVTVLLIDIDKGSVVYHSQKKKNIFSNIQNTKDFMRNKYKVKIENYYFDIVFHSTDNEKEFDNLRRAIAPYIKNFTIQTINFIEAVDDEFTNIFSE